MRNKSSKFWGLVLVVVGIMFLGNNLDWWNVNLFLEGGGLYLLLYLLFMDYLIIQIKRALLLV